MTIAWNWTREGSMIPIYICIWERHLYAFVRVTKEKPIYRLLIFAKRKKKKKKLQMNSCRLAVLICSFFLSKYIEVCHIIVVFLFKLFMNPRSHKVTNIIVCAYRIDGILCVCVLISAIALICISYIDIDEYG